MKARVPATHNWALQLRNSTGLSTAKNGQSSGPVWVQSGRNLLVVVWRKNIFYNAKNASKAVEMRVDFANSDALITILTFIFFNLIKNYDFFFFLLCWVVGNYQPSRRHTWRMKKPVSINKRPIESPTSLFIFLKRAHLSRRQHYLLISHLTKGRICTSIV